MDGERFVGVRCRRHEVIDGDEVVERRARQKLELAVSKNVSKLNG